MKLLDALRFFELSFAMVCMLLAILLRIGEDRSLGLTRFKYIKSGRNISTVRI